MKDLYLWMGATEGGPSAKFLVSGIRPLRDMRLTGNCLLGSRPILSFDAGFDDAPQRRVLKQLLTDVFSPPKGHPNSKPFHDHVLHFGWSDGKVAVRHYQVVPPLHDKSKEGDSLVEIGPRFTLTPIKLFEGLFGGETLYMSGTYVTPNTVRAERKRKRSSKTLAHVQAKEARRERVNVKGAPRAQRRRQKAGATCAREASDSRKPARVAPLFSAGLRRALPERDSCLPWQAWTRCRTIRSTRPTSLRSEAFDYLLYWGTQDLMSGRSPRKRDWRSVEGERGLLGIAQPTARVAQEFDWYWMEHAKMRNG
eukprot:1443692-Prymnesium_polylepis.1